MALKDIINSAQYGDEIALTLPDGTKATLGEMRALSAEDRAALVQRQQLVEQAELAIARKVQEFQAAGLLGSNGAPVQSQNARPTDDQIRQAAATEYGIDLNDPILGQVVKAFKAELAQHEQKFTGAIESIKNDLGAALKQVTGVVHTAVGANLEEHYNAAFGSAKSSLPSGVDVKYEDAFKYATDHGLKDKYGRLNIAEAVDRITWPKVKEAQKASLKEEVTRELESKNRLATATRPRVSGPEAHRPKSDFDPFETIKDSRTGKDRQVVKSFDQALAEASSDEALLQSALSTASFGTVN